jgi:hypothetical protein
MTSGWAIGRIYEGTEFILRVRALTVRSSDLELATSTCLRKKLLTPFSIVCKPRRALPQRIRQFCEVSAIREASPGSWNVGTYLDEGCRRQMEPIAPRPQTERC